MIKHIYDELAKRWYRGGSIFIYSDTHFNDAEVSTIRKNYIGDLEQVKRINSKVGKNDTIIFLGDIGDIEFIKKIRGYKVLVMGNHDKGASNYKRVIKKEIKYDFDFDYDIYTNGKKVQSEGWVVIDSSEGGLTFERVAEDNHLFDEVYEGPIMISDKVILSHEPISLPSFMFNIHGHDHSGSTKQINHLNVCAELIDYTPVCLKSIFEGGYLKNVTSIHRQTIDKQIKNKKERKIKNEN